MLCAVDPLQICVGRTDDGPAQVVETVSDMVGRYADARLGLVLALVALGRDGLRPLRKVCVVERGLQVGHGGPVGYQDGVLI